MHDAIKNHWIVHPVLPPHPISIRALKPKGSSLDLQPQNINYYINKYASLDRLKEHFEHEALCLNQAGYNVYTVMNLIRDDLPMRKAVQDVDIVARTTLLIDIDRVGDTSHPATNEEVAAAFHLAEEVEAYLASMGFPKPFWVHSGNGAHLYYKIDPAIEQKSAAGIDLFLKGLAKRFNNDVVGVDTTVHNSSRITKVIGTLARKGVESADRPFRVARLL